jgi:hypothetical protein
MNTVVTGGTGSGAVLFRSFPQEVADAFAKVKSGERIRVRMRRPSMPMPGLTMSGGSLCRTNRQTRRPSVRDEELSLSVQGETQSALRKYERSRSL